MEGVVVGQEAWLPRDKRPNRESVRPRPPLCDVIVNPQAAPFHVFFEFVSIVANSELEAEASSIVARGIDRAVEGESKLETWRRGKPPPPPDPSSATSGAQTHRLP
jgi:hypothetical protein